VRNNGKLFSSNSKNLNNITILYMILYHLTDEEASLSSSNVETHCMNILNIENTQEENIVLDMTTFNERDLDVIHIDKTIAKESDVSELEIQTPLSLSSTSPRKIHLYQERKYKKRIANLELQLQQTKKEENI